MKLWHDFQQVFADAVRVVADSLGFLGTHRWAAAIVVVTLIVRTLLLPLAIKQVRSMQAMQRLAPEIKRLQQKYKRDRQRLNQEMMELYRREGVNPLGGCLPLVAQMPVLIAMYYAIRQITAPSAAWLKAHGVVGNPGLGVFNMPFLGLARGCAKTTVKFASASDPEKAVNLVLTHCGLAAPALKTVAGVLLLLLMTATSWLSARQMTAGQDPQQARIAKLMPLMFVFVLMNFPAALVLYWTTQNVYQLVQQTIMLRTKTIELPARGGKERPHRPYEHRKKKPKR